LPIVLLIDDDDAIQGIVDDALSEGGFQTASAKTGEEAVTLLKGQRVAYCALVTDINLLGRLNGWEVARAAREVDPNFPVVYISGAPTTGQRKAFLTALFFGNRLPAPSLQQRSLSSLTSARQPI
jgi:CheY-like chemotaxis protein